MPTIACVMHTAAVVHMNSKAGKVDRMVATLLLPNGSYGNAHV